MRYLSAIDSCIDIQMSFGLSSSSNTGTISPATATHDPKVALHQVESFPEDFAIPSQTAIAPNAHFTHNPDKLRMGTRFPPRSIRGQRSVRTI